MSAAPAGSGSTGCGRRARTGRRGAGRWISCLALIALLGAAATALAQGPASPLPPGGIPGRALPRLPPVPGPAAQDDRIFPVPPVLERPLGAREGARVQVGRIRLAGVRPIEARAIVPAELEAMVERLRVEQQGLDKLGPNGFRPEQVEAITAFMRQVVDRPDLVMEFGRYQALVDRLRSDRLDNPPGMTIGQLQEIADALTEYYRARGMILAQAFVPAQDVVDGVVTIEVLESKLGRVLAEGNKRFPAELLAAPFEDLIDAPIVAGEIESAILTVSDYPGLSAFAVFQPGKTVGAADIVVRVQQEKALSGRVRLDNEGTRFTGNDRIVGDVTLNNPTKAGDRLSVNAVFQFNPANGVLVGGEYERPVWWPGTTVGANFEYNAFKIGAEFQGLGFEGHTATAEAFFKTTLERSRRRNVYATATIRRTSSKTEEFGTVRNQDELAMADVRVSFDSLASKARAINQGQVGLVVGLGSALGGMTNEDSSAPTPPSRIGDNGKAATSRFSKLVLSYSRLQLVGESQSLLFRTESQFSRSLLTSTEQMQIGGPNNMRAFPVSEFLADSGVFASLEWTINAPFFAAKPAFSGLTWGEIFRVSFFSDFVWGDLNEPSRADVDANVDNFLLAGYGMGLQFNVPGMINARVQAALPTGARDASNGHTVQYWFDLNYTF